MDPAFCVICFGSYRHSLLGKESNYSMGILVVMAIYLLFVVTSWVINPIANFTLLFNKDGKYALTVSEKWSAITSVSALMLGLIILAVSFVLRTPGSESLSIFIPGLVCFSFALPLSNMQFPITFKTKQPNSFISLTLVVLGLLSILMLLIDKDGATFFLVIYFIGFIGYNWTGLFRN